MAFPIVHEGRKLHQSKTEPPTIRPSDTNPPGHRIPIANGLLIHHFFHSFAGGFLKEVRVRGARLQSQARSPGDLVPQIERPCFFVSHHHFYLRDPDDSRRLPVALCSGSLGFSRSLSAGEFTHHEVALLNHLPKLLTLSKAIRNDVEIPSDTSMAAKVKEAAMMLVG